MSDRWIRCTSCENYRRHYGRRWCKACWKRWDAAGRPKAGPPPSPYRRWDEYAELTREMGHTLRQAAGRMGVSVRTAQRYEARLKIATPTTRNSESN